MQKIGVWWTETKNYNADTEVECIRCEVLFPAHYAGYPGPKSVCLRCNRNRIRRSDRSRYSNCLSCGKYFKKVIFKNFIDRCSKNCSIK